VVDRDLRIHGTRNVYVCSSSAFPTSGQANPTFFLGMFAVRLAGMLARNHA
jgi:choline dehydrogenase-like flavoprotein